MTALQQIPFKTIEGTDSSLQRFAGKVVLAVNVASKCGLTPQYAALQKLHERYRDQGLVIAGFPSNDFAGQEPGSHEEIMQFCSSTYGVDFPLFEKMTVVGPNKHPLYAALTEAKHLATGDKAPFRETLAKHGLTPTLDPEVLWNFEKFLIDREGKVIARFSPPITPDDPKLVEAIEAALGS
ncbi:MAG TPA: glutathione peroxidase [Polyangiaceae bacterium]|nr:glutathione peroxidase [Polyangiaceae bacterium]